MKDMHKIRKTKTSDKANKMPKAQEGTTGYQGETEQQRRDTKNAM